MSLSNRLTHTRRLVVRTCLLAGAYFYGTFWISTQAGPASAAP